MKVEPKEIGVVDLSTLKELGFIPSEERLLRGPVAIYECIEEIPCDVCVWACPFKAVSKSHLTSLPRVDFDRCTGCTLCAAKCPGQAIFVVNLARKDGYAYVSLPYELNPPPRRGAKAVLLSREGRELGIGEVVGFYEDNRTYLVTVKVDRSLALEVRAIRVLEG